MSGTYGPGFVATVGIDLPPWLGVGAGVGMPPRPIPIRWILDVPTGTTQRPATYTVTCDDKTHAVTRHVWERLYQLDGDAVRCAMLGFPFQVSLQLVRQCGEVIHYRLPWDDVHRSESAERAEIVARLLADGVREADAAWSLAFEDSDARLSQHNGDVFTAASRAEQRRWTERVLHVW